MSPSADPPGSAAARLGEWLDRHGLMLRRTIVHLCPRDLGLDFDDLEQEARLRLWRALERAIEIRFPASYLYRLAASVTLDAIRQATARRERFTESLAAGDGDEPPERAAAERLADPAALAERRLELRRAQGALAALAPDRRRAVGLHLQGFTPGEIAELAGWSESKARSLVYRGLNEMRGELAGPGAARGAGGKSEEEP